MIFVTVGGQLPFDRLIESIDRWAEKHQRDDLIAQTGKGTYPPKRLRAQPFLTPGEFRRVMAEADAVVAHAGIGTILSCLELQKPLLVFPRSAQLGEHRNEHQLATARHFGARGPIWAAFDEHELHEKLDQLEAHRPALHELPPPSPELIERISSYIGSRR